MRFLFPLLLLGAAVQAQTLFVHDDFEGAGTISTWFGDNCGMNTAQPNPVPDAVNASATVLEYHDTGAQYANVRFEVPANFDLSAGAAFRLKIYVPSSGFSGASPLQVSLKLQDGTQPTPWSTQSEIIRPLVADQWQTVEFDFAAGGWINLDPASAPPTTRTDFNRVVIQVNGENNFDPVLAWIDDVHFDASDVPVTPVFDQLVWNDEFNGSGAVDPAKWHHQTQLPTPGGWFNGEIQHYTDRTANAEVSGGTLKITARRETFTDQGLTRDFTSARLNSKFAFRYGRVEVRAKLPPDAGTWPAIWTLGRNINEDGAWWDLQGFGTTSWPACGEIDIMEHWGTNPDYVSSATHTPSSFGATVNVGGRVVNTATTDFHVYGLTWTADRLVFDVDGVVHYTYDPPVKDASTWPFDAQQYLLLNVAMLPSVDPAFSSAAMEVDYVRVYQESNCTPPANPVATVTGPTSATLSWDAVPGAIGYQITGGPVGGAARNLRTTGTSRTIPVLSPGTTYQWTVRAWCDPVLSAATPVQLFGTPLSREVAMEAPMVYPNPGRGSVRVTWPWSGEGSLRLTDLSGRVWSEHPVGPGVSSLDLGGVPPGVYLLTWRQDGVRHHERLLVH